MHHSYLIQNSEIIIHNGCTGGIEGFIRKKKVISFKPLNEDGVLEFANQFGYSAKNQVELGDIIETIYDEMEPKKINEELYSKFVSRYGDIIHSNAIQNIISEWEEYNIIEEKLSRQNNLFLIKIKNKLRFLKNFFIKPIKNEKFPVFEKKIMEKLFNSLKKTDQKLNKVKFDLIGPKLFKLRLSND